MSVKKQVISIIILFLFAWLISFGVTEKINPLDAWKDCNLIIKVIILIILFIAFLQLLGALYVGLFISENAECARPDCHRNIRAYLPVLKNVVQCPVCKRFFHKECWKIVNGTEPTIRVVMKGCKLHQDHETGRKRLFDEDDIFYQKFRE